MLPVDVMKNSTLVASDALFKVLGGTGAALIAVLVIISTAGADNGNIMPSARVIYAMGEERHFFPFTAKVHPQNHTPANALWLQGIWASILVFIGSFDMLMDMFVFITWIYYGFGAYGIFILRKKMPNTDNDSFKVKFYPYLPIIFIAFSVLYVVVTLYNDTTSYLAGQNPIINSVFGLVLTASGIPLYWLFSRKRSG
jgi:APA family basic amino acid/polyamine antiporter